MSAEQVTLSEAGSDNSVMTPLQKLRWAVLVRANQIHRTDCPKATAENVDELWDDMVARDLHWDAVEEVRNTHVDSDLPSTHGDYKMSRHFLEKSVAYQIPDGSWVGSTFWYGGGKHSEPGAWPWMENAYDVQCTEMPVTIVRRTFTRDDVTTSG